jgi:hypothetical protein
VKHSEGRPDRRGQPSYTDLYVRISEEGDVYVIQVRLTAGADPDQAAWGEEVATTFEAASQMVGDIAAEFSISQTRIKIDLRMNNPNAGTRH